MNDKITYTMSADKHNVLAMCTRAEAENLFRIRVGVVFSDLVVVEEWDLTPEDGRVGFELEYFEKEGTVKPGNEVYYTPIIPGTKVDWRFSEEYLVDAYRIFAVFKDYPPRILSAKIASPLWLELAIDEHKRKPEDLVILIAPILSN